MIRLNKEMILKIHDEQISLYGGMLGIRDEGLFASQCEMPYQTFYGEDLFPDVYDKATRYLFGFATNQVFIDGNKRTAVMTALVFLVVNGVELDVSNEELYKTSILVANKMITEENVKRFFIEHTI